MKFLILLAALCAVTLAAPRPDEVEIVNRDVEVGPEDFKFDVKTSDGSQHEAYGNLKDVGTDHEALVVHGSYTWFDEKTNERFTVSYTADENGYRAFGNHLPVF